MAKKTNTTKSPSLSAFYKQHPDVDISQYNLGRKEGIHQLKTHLKKKGVPAGEMSETVELLKTQHRLGHLTGDVKTQEKLMSMGLNSANHIARIPRNDFIADHAKKLKLSRTDAVQMHKTATGIRNKSMHLWASLRGSVVSPFYRKSPLNNVSAAIAEEFQDLPSYQEMFGTLDFCGCPECRSIFGPAAYLTDLLRIIQEYVYEPNKDTIPPSLYFATRRPDIGEIELTCGNTNTLIPFIQIVIERLVAYIQAKLKLASPDAVFEQVATTIKYPMQLPFNSPMSTTQILFQKADVTFGAVLSAWMAPANISSPRNLGISPEAQSILITPVTTSAGIAPFYNVTDITVLNIADTFIAKTWINFAELLLILNQDLSDAEQQAGLQVNFFINQGLAGKWVSIKQEKDKPAELLNLNVDPLDRINRLRRLSLITGKTMMDLDWMLRCIKKGSTPIIDDAAITGVDQLLQLATTLELDMLKITSLLGPIKTYGISENALGSQFDQLFNKPGAVAEKDIYHPSGNPLNPGYKSTPLPWTPGSSTGADLAAINRVLPGLGIALTDANLLGVALYANNQQQLTVDTLSQLYRHVTLSKALQLTMPRYLIFVSLMKLVDIKAPTLDEISKMIAVSTWMQLSGITVYQLDYIMNAVSSVYVNPMYLPDLVDEWLRSLWVSVPADSPTLGADITAQVAILFGSDNTMLMPVMQMSVAAVPLPTGVTTWEEGFMTADADGKTPKYSDYVHKVLAYVSRWLVLSGALSTTAATMANVALCPAAYELTSKFDIISLNTIQEIDLVQQMMTVYGDQQNKLLAYIQQSTDGVAIDTRLQTLQDATGWNPKEVKSLLDGPLKDISVLTIQLKDLQSCFELMTALGVDTMFMSTFVSTMSLPTVGNWTKYLQVAADTLAKTAGRYGSGWDAVSNSINGDMMLAVRDALLVLVMALLNEDYPGITAPRNVYEFLLIDVEMGAETQISYIKEALNAAQTYLQRCHLRLEPGVTDMSRIQPVWWEWMMNYRVWEANRQIFVYPENYLIPSLRTNTTPQFTTLVQALQQSDITKAYVTNAFTNYMNGFEEVAELKPVDAYSTVVEGVDTTFLLARTKTDPYTFYYCSQEEGLPWSPWEKIDLSINSPNCSLVYAFNRPFIFWNEIKRSNASAVSGTDGSVQTDNSITYTASVYYSFLNVEGVWVQAQTLVDQEVVLFEAQDNRKVNLMDESIFEGLFNMDAPYWNKVYAFNVTADNYVITPGNKSEAERLVVMYGPCMQNTGKMVDAQATPPSNDPNSGTFWENLHRLAENHNSMVKGELSGNVNLQPVYVLNAGLEDGVLMKRTEWLMADPYVTQSLMYLIHGEMQSSGDVMQVSHTGQPITDNRNIVGTVSLNTTSAATSLDGDAFISVGISPAQSSSVFAALKTAGVIKGDNTIDPAKMLTLDLFTALKPMTVYNDFGPAQFPAVLQVLFSNMAATPLFSALADAQARICPVEGLPGSFLFYASDEIFLLSPQRTVPNQPMFSNFARGLTVGPPLIYAPFCIMNYQGTTPGAINADASSKVFDALAKFSLIVNNRPVANITQAMVDFALANLVSLGTITEAQVPYIFNALINAPFLFVEDFVGPKMNKDAATKVYQDLQKFSIIDPNGRVVNANVTGPAVRIAMGNLLLLGTITQSQITNIYQVLAHAPMALSLTYINDGDAKTKTSPADYIFNVTRMSTGAINKVNRALFVNGVDALLTLKMQDIPVIPVQPFDRFAPSRTNLNWPSALDATQVDFDGLYGQYYWEIFFFIPMLIAEGLATNHRFPEAQAWMQYVFNPTVGEVFVTPDLIYRESDMQISEQQGTIIVATLKSHNIGTPPAPILNAAGEVNPGFKASDDLAFLKVADPSLTDEQIIMVRNILLNNQLNAPASHFWQFRPFRNHTLESLSDMLSDSNPAIRIYNDHPFDPFAIARLRIGAFEKSVFIQYVDNLIAWADMLFAQDTWETITAAYLLYVYAYDLLGPKPEMVGECPGSDVVLTFNEILAKYPNGIPQFLIDLENFVNGNGSDTPMLGHAFNDLYVYFCVPENSELMARWDTIQDRMYKINNSLNIQGVFRTLALFEPPLNPLDLVKAAAAGNNVQISINPAAQLSPYRFSSAISAADTLCSVVIDLGNALLSALEKNDAAALEMIRNTQEGQILDLTTKIKEDHITELEHTIASLNSNLSSANERLTFYTDVIDRGLSSFEQTSLDAAAAAMAFNVLGSITKTAASIGYAVPQVGSPFAMTYGGEQLGNALNAASGVFEISAEVSTYISANSATMGGYERRKEDWKLQKKIAQADVDSITQQIDAANMQLSSAQQDLVVQLKSIQQNKDIDKYLRTQFTNQDLYLWMMGRLAAVYYQTYTLAMQTARQAEAAYQLELGSSLTFLSFDYWDSFHKGLTAGEGLRLALNRMNTSYRTSNTRYLEIVKNISLASIAPQALLDLKTKGECDFDLKESLFDYDYPGQYLRMIASVSVSIPAVLGPYQNIKATLTQKSNSVVTAPSIDAVKYLLGIDSTPPSTGLRQNWRANEMIALSTAVNDSGMFVLNFDDERYLPFEGTGVVSSWHLSMPMETNRFNFEQISDVILTLNYTAVNDNSLGIQVRQALGQAPLNGGLYVDANTQSSAWFTFLNDHSNTTKQALTLNLDLAQLGYFKTATYTTVMVQFNLGPGVTIPNGATFLTIKAGTQPDQTPPINNGMINITGLTWNAKTIPPQWRFEFALNDPKIASLLKDGFIDGTKLIDMQVIVLYEAKVF
ncbi:virulence plasmid A protein [Chitinophaga polysaccharea]|uniref:Virulence plasmid A protein n=1 Tax=Chitinophaga polysaccharea TaxID=1293035 RepID=A0A561PVV0_9BACT|nr:neuraminidase-like domain-containing protein [Chitinophaga polysaccharea]TWF42253.1 virulence plasmid A protein [Chitinophaga polysaccharea]